MIQSFINQFSKYPDAIECFTNGMCYWFAHILYYRFCAEKTVTIMYDPIMNHFGCKIEKEIYDINGIVTNKYKWIEWDEYTKQDPIHTARIYRDCVRKEVF